MGVTALTQSINQSDLLKKHRIGGRLVGLDGPVWSVGFHGGRRTIVAQREQRSWREKKKRRDREG